MEIGSHDWAYFISRDLISSSSSTSCCFWTPFSIFHCVRKIYVYTFCKDDTDRLNFLHLANGLTLLCLPDNRLVQLVTLITKLALELLLAIEAFDKLSSDLSSEDDLLTKIANLFHNLILLSDHICNLYDAFASPQLNELEFFANISRLTQNQAKAEQIVVRILQDCPEFGTASQFMDLATRLSKLKAGARQVVHAADAQVEQDRRTLGVAAVYFHI